MAVADHLKQFLQPSERLLYREPVEQDGWIHHCLFAIAMPFAVPVIQGKLDPLKSFMATFLIIEICLDLLRRLKALGVAVTDRRVLQLRNARHGPRLTEVEADEVNAIEILGNAVRITKKDGSTAVLAGLQDGAKVGLTLARAAGIQPPWVPGPKERLAAEVHRIVSLVGAALAFTVARAAFADEGLVPAVSYAAAAGAIGWLLGTLAGLALLRPFLTRSEMRAWMRQSRVFSPKPEPGSRTGPFGRFCLWFIDLLYPPPGTPPDSGEAHYDHR